MTTTGSSLTAAAVDPGRESTRRCVEDALALASQASQDMRAAIEAARSRRDGHDERQLRAALRAACQLQREEGSLDDDDTAREALAEAEMALRIQDVGTTRAMRLQPRADRLLRLPQLEVPGHPGSFVRASVDFMSHPVLGEMARLNLDTNTGPVSDAVWLCEWRDGSLSFSDDLCVFEDDDRGAGGPAGVSAAQRLLSKRFVVLACEQLRGSLSRDDESIRRLYEEIVAGLGRAERAADSGIASQVYKPLFMEMAPAHRGAPELIELPVTAGASPRQRAAA